MTIFLLILLLIAIGALIQQKRYRTRLTTASSKTIEALHLENIQLRKDNKALEEGNQEIVDNYENDFLSFKEKIEVVQNSAKYDQEMREEAERLGALKDYIIEKHAGHCDSILHDVVEGMMDELKPKESSDG